MSRKETVSIWILLSAFFCLAVLTAVMWHVSRTEVPAYTGRELTGVKKEEVAGRNSPLTEYIYLTPNATFPREDKITKITIHHMAADLSLEEAGELFSRTEGNASANYAIDSEGHIGLYVEEKDRAWTSSDPENDACAVTIEVANDEIGGQWHVSDAAYAALLDLCTDICRRNGIRQLTFTGAADGSLTMHRMFSDETECPGPYLESRMAEIADAVNERLTQERQDTF